MTNQPTKQADTTSPARSNAAGTGSRPTLRARLRGFAQRAQVGWLLGIVALAPLGMGARGCDQAVIGADCTKDGDAGSAACACEYDGKHYAAGDSFPCTDGCNHCTCEKNGKVASTSIGCGGIPDAGGGNGNSCGGLTGAGCGKSEYCEFAPDAQCGAADQTGKCAPRPEVCDAIYAPVCGCDDKTYSSSCVAASKGVSVASNGECNGGQDAGSGCDYDGKHYALGDTFQASDGCNKCTCMKGGAACTEIGCNPGGTGKTCGGIAGIQCAADEYCNLGKACGLTDQSGTCETIPKACTKEYAPVCGCDSQTYGNACTAASSSESVAAQGECPNADAGTGTGCDVGGMHYAIGDSFPDADGCNQCSCTAKGAVCTLIACDPGTGKACGGIAGIQCDGKQYCDFAPATMCGSGDQQGTCRDRPDVCTQVFAQVCGCDGNTYSSACFAAVAGISVLSTGACSNTK